MVVGAGVKHARVSVYVCRGPVERLEGGQCEGAFIVELCERIGV